MDFIRFQGLWNVTCNKQANIRIKSSQIKYFQSEEIAAHHTVLLAKGGKGKPHLLPFDALSLHELVGTECGIGAAIKKGVGYS